MRQVVEARRGGGVADLQAACPARCQPIETRRQHGPGQAAPLVLILDSHRLQHPNLSHRIEPKEGVTADLTVSSFSGEVQCRVVERALAETGLDLFAVSHLSEEAIDRLSDQLKNRDSTAARTTLLPDTPRPEMLVVAMTLADGTPLSPALGIGAFAEKTLVASGQCTKVDPAARAAAVGLLGCGVMAGLGAAINTTASTMTPLSTIARWSTRSTAAQVNHQDAAPAATISFSTGNGFALSDAIARIRQVQASLNFPTQVHGEASGTAQVFQQSTQSNPILILSAFAVPPALQHRVLMWGVIGAMRSSMVSTAKSVDPSR